MQINQQENPDQITYVHIFVYVYEHGVSFERVLITSWIERAEKFPGNFSKLYSSMLYYYLLLIHYAYVRIICTFAYFFEFSYLCLYISFWYPCKFFSISTKS